MAVSFVAAGQADLGSLRHLVGEFYREAGYPLDAGRRAAVADALARLVADEALGRAWLMRAHGECAGYLVVTLGFSVEHGGRDAFVDELYVVPALRGRGLGAAAIAHAQRYCRERGVRALHLEVESVNAAAARLYQRAGFRGTDRRLLTLDIDDGGGA